MMPLAGVFAPISTPFADDEEVNFKALAFNVERYAGTDLLGLPGARFERRESQPDGRRTARRAALDRAPQAAGPGGDGGRHL